VTPSALDSNFLGLQVGNAAYLISGNNQFASFSVFASNAFYDTVSTFKYKNTGFATRYQQNDGAHAWFTAPSGTAGNAITFTQAMTLDASGNLMVGTTSATGKFNVTVASSGTFQTSSYFTNAVDVDFYTRLKTGVAEIGSTTSTPLTFATASTERARISSTGETSVVSAGDFGVVGSLTASAGTTKAVFIGRYNATAGNFSSGTDSFIVWSNGNVINTNNSYGAISDAKMKTDIVDAGSQWADIKAVRFRKFKMKDDPIGLMQLGVIAQELEQTSPGLIDEHLDRDAEGNDLGTTTKSVKTSVLLMKAAVALQEAMARIEQLEADVAALKGT
jgi:hypothetical protein